jgi:DNA-binding CsgD family transcriptional regulator
MVMTLSDPRWIDLAAEILDSHATTWPAEAVSRQLVDAFDGFGCGYRVGQAEKGVQGLWPPERFIEHADEISRWSRRKAATEHPILCYYLATCEIRPIQVDDVPPHIATPRLISDWTERGRRWGGIHHQLALPLAVTATERTGFVIGRADPFTAQEIDQACTLVRLLAALDRHFAACSCYAGAGPRTDIAEEVRLTPRQLVVLALLADGLTATAIGHRLLITERTVHKHLERIYAKLGVTDRLGAVMRAQRIGLLPDQSARSA